MCSRILLTVDQWRRRQRRDRPVTVSAIGKQQETCSHVHQQSRFVLTRFKKSRRLQLDPGAWNTQPLPVSSPAKQECPEFVCKYMPPKCNSFCECSLLAFWLHACGTFQIEEMRSMNVLFLCQEARWQPVWESMTRCNTFCLPSRHGASVRRAAWGHFCSALGRKAWGTRCRTLEWWSINHPDRLLWVFVSGFGLCLQLKLSFSQTDTVPQCQCRAFGSENRVKCSIQSFVCR